MIKSSFLSALLCLCSTPLVAQTAPALLRIDTHSHVDIPMEKQAMPVKVIDLSQAMKKAGMDVIGMTFAVDYVKLKYEGHAWERFKNALEGQDAILKFSKMTRALTAADIIKAHQKGEPTVIQCVEGAHFLEGNISRLDSAYQRGLRIFTLLHDNDATPSLGDIYTEEPRHGGLTPLGVAAIRESERLGILVDLAHCDSATIMGALQVAKKPMIITHTGLNTRLGNKDFMAKMMYKRLISPTLARTLAAHDVVLGVWPHLASTAEEYAKNIKAMVDVVGIDHVCIGTDTKITPGIHEWEHSDKKQADQRPQGNMPPKDEKPQGNTPPKGDKPQGGPMKQPNPNAKNHVFEEDPENFYTSLIHHLEAEGFTTEDIQKISSGNFLRVFESATQPSL